MSNNKIGRNDLCPCGSGRKYKKCCMPKSSRTKGIMKNFGKRLFLDHAKKVPIVGSFINAVEDTNSDMKEKDTELDLEEMHGKMDYTVDSIAHLETMMPILSPQHNISKMAQLLTLLDIEAKNNPDFDINIVSLDDKKEVQLSPKNQDIKINVKLKFSVEELNGKKDLKEYIESKMKEGKTVIFTEDQIEELIINNPQFKNYEKPSEIKFIPTSSNKPLTLDFLIEGTNLGYHDVKMKTVYGNGQEATLVSSNLPFEIMLYLSRDTQKAKFTARFDLDEIPILDLNKLLDFLSAFNNGKKVVCNDSRRGKTYFTSEVTSPIEIDGHLLDITRKLANIDIRFNLDLMFPKELKPVDYEAIAILNCFIDNNYIPFNIGDVDLDIDSEILNRIIGNYETDGFIDDFEITQKMYVTIFGNEIYLGEGKIEMPRVVFSDDAETLRQKIKASDKIAVTLIPLENKAKMIF